MEFNDQQKEAIKFFEGSCNVLASAGSGKSQVIIERCLNLIKHHHVHANNILLLTFSRKAVENLQYRICTKLPDNYGQPNIETFHSLGYRIIRDISTTKYEILNSDYKVLDILKPIILKYYPDMEEDSFTGTGFGDYLNMMSYAKNTLQNVNYDDPFFEDICRDYEEVKRINHYIDFDDMLIKPYKLLQKFEAYRQHYQEQFQFIMVDEMQDTNAVQYEMIKMLAGDRQNIMLVGDPLQTIFSFRGSTNEFVMKFDDEWRDPHTIVLNTNYRSTKNIIQYANRFADYIPESHHKHYIASKANKDEYKDPVLLHSMGCMDEARDVSEIIRKHVASGGYKFSDFAVLTRTNAQLQAFETGFFANKIPHEMRGDLSLVDRKEIRIILSYLKMFLDTSNNEAFKYIYNKPFRRLGKVFLEQIEKDTRNGRMSYYDAAYEMSRKSGRFRLGCKDLVSTIESLRRLKGQSLDSILKWIIHNIDPCKICRNDRFKDNDDSHEEYVDTFLMISEDYKTVKELVKFFDDYQKLHKDNQGDNVQLMTIHKSKGLEFPVVFIGGVNADTLPHKRSMDLDEEKRLMYVAMTRAEKLLYISTTDFNIRKKLTSPSPFIKMIFGATK